METTKTLSRVGALSFAKVMGIIYACLGLIGGLLYAVMLFIIGVAAIADSNDEGIMAIFGGCAALFGLPLIYGILGFLFGLLMAALYNFVAKRWGGVELTLQDHAGTA